MKPWQRAQAPRTSDAWRAVGRGSTRPSNWSWTELGSCNQGHEEQPGTLSSSYTHTQHALHLSREKVP